MRNLLADRQLTGADVAKLGALLWIGSEALGPEGVELSPAALRDQFREWATRDPIDTLVATVVGGSYLFWLAEKDENPMCRTFWDALTFITTCLSVGYNNVFAKTDAGKAIASWVMTFGPAMTNRALDPPAPAPAAQG